MSKDEVIIFFISGTLIFFLSPHTACTSLPLFSCCWVAGARSSIFAIQRCRSWSSCWSRRWASYCLTAAAPGAFLGYYKSRCIWWWGTPGLGICRPAVIFHTPSTLRWHFFCNFACWLWRIFLSSPTLTAVCCLETRASLSLRLFIRTSVGLELFVLQVQKLQQVDRKYRSRKTSWDNHQHKNQPFNRIFNREFAVPDCCHSLHTIVHLSHNAALRRH